MFKEIRKFEYTDNENETNSNLLYYLQKIMNAAKKWIRFDYRPVLVISNNLFVFSFMMECFFFRNLYIK